MEAKSRSRGRLADDDDEDEEEGGVDTIDLFAPIGDIDESIDADEVDSDNEVNG
jgi:hypothetical protein